MKAIINTSARHIHITDADLAVLFGEGARLIKKKDLLQPGEFASEQRINLIGPKKNISNVTILGPIRKATQVEISLSDARTLGIDVSIRASGDTAGSSGCILEGPCGRIELSEGVIAAKRHLHATPNDAGVLGIRDQDTIRVKVDSPAGRSLIFDDVLVRVSESFALEIHIDTDEANAAALSGEVFGEIITS